MQKAETIELSKRVLKLGPNNGAVFWVAELPTILPGDGIVVGGTLPKFHSRADDTALVKMVGDTMHMPRAFHASMQASALLLHHYHAHGLKLEGERTQLLSPQGILKAYARLYEIEDVNDVAKFYPECRARLSHINLDHPTTLEGVINAVKISQKRMIN